jgi:sugar phosphate permease
LSQKSSRSGALIIAIGAIAYISAVTQRSTMGIASLVATDRFQTTAEQLSMLAVAQLIVYAAMQIPVGLLLDRWGPRRLLSIGALSMALGQYVVAFAPSLGLAVTGRMLVGFGDAFTFISMIRLINGWYSGKRASQLQQWLGNGGQVGQIVSAVPFSILLHASGWQVSFTVWATIALIIGTLGLILIVDEPIKHAHDVGTLREQLGLLRKSVRSSSTRLAFWVHFSTQSSTTVIVLLWGVPFLEQGEGLSKTAVTWVLTSFVALGFLGGLAFGQLCAHRPDLRRPVLSVTAGAMLTSWVALLAYPGPAPAWLICVWVFFVSTNAPASMVAFDYTREFVPKRELGAANGFVNIGGFLATFTMMFLIGVVLDVFYVAFGESRGLPLYSLEGFRLAFISVPLIIGSGFLMYLKNEKITRNLHQLGLKP